MLRPLVGLAILSLVSTQASAQTYFFDVQYNGGGNAVLAPGSDNPVGTTLLPGDSFLWTITAQGGNAWSVINTAWHFPFMAFGIAEAGNRIGDYALTLYNGGSTVYSQSEIGVANSFVHLGTNSINLSAGLVFDMMRLDFTLFSAVEDPQYAVDPNNLQNIGTTPSTLLAIFGAPELSQYNPGDIVYGPTATVPEPSTYALMAAGLTALGVIARRRRVQQSV